GRALGFAHERGFVHRDVTPANILFDPTGNPVLTDFGIARAVGGSTRITHTGVSIGTSIYMSPEQARGAEVDARSDLYSLGVLAYEALTGDVPYKGADSFAVAYAHVFEPIPRLPAERGNWQGLIDKALAKDPRDRYGSAEEFCAALSVMGAGGESATTQKMATLPGSSSKELVRPAAVTQLVEAVGKRMKRSQGQGFGPKLALGALALVAVLALGYGVYSQWAQPDDSAPVATTADPPAPTLKPVRPAPPLVTVDPDVPVEGQPPADAIPTDYPLVDGEPVEGQSPVGPPSREAQLAGWLRASERATAELRLTTPAGSSAVDFQRWVLQLDPENAKAQEGIGAVVERYLDLARTARDEQRLDDARSLIERARQVAAEHPAPVTLQQRINEQETDWVGVLIGRAEGALKAWDRTTALAALDEAAQLVPTDPRIASLRQQAEGFAQQGFAFRDALSSGSQGPQMVVVAPRQATLGGARDSKAVRLGKPFAVATTEVTRGQFARFVQATGRQIGGNCRDRERTGLFGAVKSSRTWREPDIQQGDDHPVVCVDFDDAQAYVRWLGQETGHVYRLLSESEWQALAARVPAEAACKVANLSDRTRGGRGSFTCSDGFEATAPVRQLGASGGLYDLDGNVREWVQDCSNESHAGHPGNAQPRLNGDCTERMVMGRAWHSDQEESTPIQRKAFKSNVRSNTIGFRVAMTMPDGPPAGQLRQ
ncbi:MAG: SUMF1/EgtB/PvdO family nonheme iron enzyme, partial [Xanthomonadales bacterium]|nr:SUMF1/EgtB/PvdO family nonheme iron enzyme [Xanthomonadales bacterium]